MHVSGPNTRVTLGQCSSHWGHTSARDSTSQHSGESYRALEGTTVCACPEVVMADTDIC